MPSANLAVLADKFQQWVDGPLEKVDDELSVTGRQDFWQSVQPGQHQRSPSERHWLQVDHSTAADRRRLITSAMCSFYSRILTTWYCSQLASFQPVWPYRDCFLHSPAHSMEHSAICPA